MHGFTESRWRKLWRCLKGSEDPEIIFDDIRRKYGASSRAYRTIEHVNHCLSDLDRIRSHLQNAAAVELAMILHDVEDTEQESVRYLVKVAEYGKLPKDIVRVAIGIVLATDHRVPYADPDKQYAMDIDLVILGRPPVAFDRSEAQIRREYKQFSDREYAEERREKLKYFLNRSSGIYLTAYFRTRYETQARANLTLAISRL